MTAPLLVLLITFTAVSYAQTVPSKHLNLDEDNLALNGYDPVAYFKQHKAVKGKSSITATVDGVTYQFSTQVNKDLFVSSPLLYKPQYGGWCAYAMGAEGEKVEVDPETFKIVDGKLYLFYNRFFTNTLNTWNANEAELKTSADKNWNKLIKP
ncbi:MAG TPA: YHS domain-containing (seleno)protein [Ohtaekwangia sp.]